MRLNLTKFCDPEERCIVVGVVVVVVSMSIYVIYVTYVTYIHFLPDNVSSIYIFIFIYIKCFKKGTFRPHFFECVPDFYELYKKI